MAIGPNEFPLTRQQVFDWIEAFSVDHQNPTSPEATKETLDSFRNYLESEVEALNLEDQYVLTPEHVTLSETTHIVDMVMLDLPSYG